MQSERANVCTAIPLARVVVAEALVPSIDSQPNALMQDSRHAMAALVTLDVVRLEELLFQC